MTGRRRTTFFALAAAAAGVVALVRRHVGGAFGRPAHGGILIADPRRYDSLSHLFLTSFLDGVASDVAAVAPPGARVLEIGCGPGRLALSLTRRYGLDVTGVDLDPAMIERARANARADGRGDPSPSFLVGDVASLPLPDGSFDVVVSTLSMHHWDDRAAGLAEVGRVLRPGGRALIWDLRAGRVPLHGVMRDPAEAVHGTPLRIASATPWRWPWRLTPTTRLELTGSDDRSA